MSAPFQGPPQASPASAPVSIAEQKRALRARVQAARDNLTEAELAEASRELTRRALALREVREAATVTAYVSVGSEPGVRELIEALRQWGKRVLLPLTVRRSYGLDLEWANYHGPDSLRPVRYGLLEPDPAESLGTEAIAEADVVLAPGMAISASGFRIGKGAGCYDRALARIGPETTTIGIFFDTELGLDVPVEAHDVPLHAALGPNRLMRMRRA